MNEIEEIREGRLKLSSLALALRTGGVPPDRRSEAASIASWACDHIDALEAENERLKGFFEVVFRDVWDMEEPDGGCLQDTAEDMGLLVKVPADEAFKAEWDHDEMYVWAWNPLATAALKGESDERD